MVFLRVVSKSEIKIEEIAAVLLKEKLAIDVNIKRGVERAELINEELLLSRIFLLTAKTKAELFEKIDELLNDMYPNNLPEVYALPIMQMDWKQAAHLTKDVRTIPRGARIKQMLKRVRGKGA